MARFDFTLLDQRSLNGRTAFRVAFAPKSPEPPERRLADRLLNRITGTLWIDAQEFELAQADIRLGSEVNLLGGIAGSLRKLSYTMTRTRVADGLWLSTATNGDFEGRKLLVSKRIKTRSQSANFRPLAMQAANQAHWLRKPEVRLSPVAHAPTSQTLCFQNYPPDAPGWPCRRIDVVNSFPKKDWSNRFLSGKTVKCDG